MDYREAKAPPDRWQDFEDLCLKLWRPRLIDAKKHGRSGQPQAGVDIFGRDPQTEGWIGIQCKQKGQWRPQVLTIGQIEAEIREAESFEPPLLHFIVATTARRDVETQAHVRKLSEQRREAGQFTVDLFAWDDIQEWLHEDPEIHPVNARRRRSEVARTPESGIARLRQPYSPGGTDDPRDSVFAAIIDRIKDRGGQERSLSYVSSYNVESAPAFARDVVPETWKRDVSILAESLLHGPDDPELAIRRFLELRTGARYLYDRSKPILDRLEIDPLSEDGIDVMLALAVLGVFDEQG